jgi:hypothetical protein
LSQELTIPLHAGGLQWWGNGGAWEAEGAGKGVKMRLSAELREAHAFASNGRRFGCVISLDVACFREIGVPMLKLDTWQLKITVFFPVLSQGKGLVALFL